MKDRMTRVEAKLAEMERAAAARYVCTVNTYS